MDLIDYTFELQRLAIESNGQAREAYDEAIKHLLITCRYIKAAEAYKENDGQRAEHNINKAQSLLRS